MDIRDYIEHLKSKPEHVRRRIAFGTSAGITGVVAVAWLVALSTSGTLALTSPEVQNTAELKTAVQETSSSFAELMGAASAYQSAAQGESELIIVDAQSSSTLDAPADPTEGKTVIPF
jgi:hypothetical protein